MDKFAVSFRDLDVYQNGLSLVVDIHAFSKGLPADAR